MILRQIQDPAHMLIHYYMDCGIEINVDIIKQENANKELNKNIMFGKPLKNKIVAFTADKLIDEDWKTAIAKNKRPIPQCKPVLITRTNLNYYGLFYECEYNDTMYNLKPADLIIVEEI